MNASALNYQYDFGVVAIARSGTLWLSRLLSFGEHSICFHEPQTRDVDVASAGGFYRRVGFATTCGNLSQLDAEKKVYVVRDRESAWESLYNLGFEEYRGHFDACYDSLIAGAKSGDGLVVLYADLFTRDSCEKIWEHIHGGLLPPWRYDEHVRMSATVTKEAMANELGNQGVELCQPHG